MFGTFIVVTFLFWVCHCLLELGSKAADTSDFYSFIKGLTVSMCGAVGAAALLYSLILGKWALQ